MPSRLSSYFCPSSSTTTTNSFTLDGAMPPSLATSVYSSEGEFTRQKSKKTSQKVFLHANQGTKTFNTKIYNDYKSWTRIQIKSGSVIVFDQKIWHRGTCNTGDKSRYIMILSYYAPSDSAYNTDVDFGKQILPMGFEHELQSTTCWLQQISFDTLNTILGPNKQASIEGW